MRQETLQGTRYGKPLGLGGLPSKEECRAKNLGRGEEGAVEGGRRAEEQDRGNRGGACHNPEGAEQGDNPQLDVPDLHREFG